MPSEKRVALTNCCSVIAGLFVGFGFYLSMRAQWIYADVFSTFANYVSQVLFTALLMSFGVGVVISVIVFPLHFFFLKRPNKVLTLTYGVMGFIAGYSLLNIIKPPLY